MGIRIYAWLEPEHGDGFGTGEIIQLFDSESELMNINRPASGKVAP